MGNEVYERRPTELPNHIGYGQDDTRAEAIAADGRIALGIADRARGNSRMRQFLEGQKETSPVVAGMRRSARY